MMNHWHMAFGRALALALVAAAAGCGERAATGDDDGYTFEYCEDGTIKTAKCEGGLCDPLPFNDCGDGTCVLQPGTCASGQKGDYYDVEHCDDGLIQTAQCPVGTSCDAAPFDDCGDGTCTLMPQMCPEVESSGGYEYEYCEDGTIKTATCEGGLCDPLPFDDCGDGTCVIAPETCPDPTSGTCGCKPTEICVRGFDGTCTDMGHKCIELPAECVDDPCGVCAELLCGTSPDGYPAGACDYEPCPAPLDAPWVFDHACYYP